VANAELQRALELAGNTARLAEQTGLKRRTVYWQVNRGFLSFEFAKRVGEQYGLDPLKLQER
jgi:hypothetical protein